MNDLRASVLAHSRQDYIPKPYQVPMTDHVLDLPRCALYARMGMGKTCPVLTALDALFLAGEDHPALVLGTKRIARKVWSDEAAKWNHLRQIEVARIVGEQDQRRLALRNRRANVFTTNYEQLPWLVEELGDRWPFRVVIADEATRLKGFRVKQGGKRAHALAALAHTKIQRFIELTGTPSPNGLKDLWGQVWFLDAGARLGRTYSAFEERWFYKPVRGGDFTQLKPMPFAMEQIQEKLRDLCLTLDPKDYFDLAEPIVNTVEVDLPPRVRSVYREMEKKMFAELTGGISIAALNAASRTGKCLQIAAGAVYTDDKATQWSVLHDEKLEALEDVIEEAAGMPVLVAYHWRHTLDRLKKWFPQGRVLHSAKDEDEWNAGLVPLMFAHPKSCGHGLNLQDGGNILAYIDHDWNLEEREQILERIGPMRQKQSGHDRPVYVYNIVARDTVDEAVIARVAGKSSVQQALLDYMKRIEALLG